MKHVSPEEPEENHRLLSPTSHNAPVVEGPAKIDRLNVALLFVAAFLYDFAVGGAISLLGSFVLKAPLSWTAAQVYLFGPFVVVLVFLSDYLLSSLRLFFFLPSGGVRERSRLRDFLH